MRAVSGGAIDFLHAFHAKLHPAGRAMFAHAAAAVVVLHHAHADLGLVLGNAGAYCNHDAAGLVAGNDRAGELAEAQRRSTADRAVELQIAAAHAGSLDLEHDFAGSRRRIRKLHELNLASAGEYDSFHALLLLFGLFSYARMRGGTTQSVHPFAFSVSSTQRRSALPCAMLSSNARSFASKELTAASTASACAGATKTKPSASPTTMSPG